MIRLESVYRDYGKDEKATHALNGVSLTFEDRGFVAILGPSGCGKTTLLNVMGGLDKPTGGTLYVDGKDTSEFDDRDLDEYRNERIGFVFQEYNLLPEMSALDNVRLSLDIGKVDRRISKGMAIEALTMVGLEDKCASRPHQLSGGQCQRVSIARAIVRNPSVILADEPTGALDSKSGTEIMEILKKISSDRLVVMVTHNESLANEYATRIIRLKDGVVESDTNPFEEGKKDVFDDYLLDAGRKKRKVGLGFKESLMTGLRHAFNKIGRSLSVAVTITFGIMALGFAMALSNGFGGYVQRINTTTGSHAPIVISSYSRSSATSSWTSYNQTEEYPSSDSIYPTYTPTGSYTYKYNNFTDKFFDYVKTLKDEGLLTGYVLKRSEDNAMKIVTDYPAALNPGGLDEDSENVDAGYKFVDASKSSTMVSGTGGNSYVANTVFHALLSNYEDSYDLLAGRLPTNKNELVMIVDYRNAISFSTLQELGFYNPNDTQNDILDSSYKVEPIGFDDIIGKEYKIYSLLGAYESAQDIVSNEPTKVVDVESFPVTEEVVDDDGVKRTITRYVPKTAKELAKETPLESDKTGLTAKIVGVIRPNKNSKKGSMNSGIGYLYDSNDESALSGLAETIRSYNDESPMLDAYKNSFVRKTPWGYDKSEGLYVASDPISSNKMGEELKSYIDEIERSNGTISTTDLQTMFEKYFTGYRTYSTNFDPRRNKRKDGVVREEGYLYPYKTYTSLKSYFTTASSLGIDFSDDELKGVTMDDTSAIKEYVNGIVADYLADRVDTYYSKILALGQLVYAQSNVSAVVLLPSSISEAKEVLARLEEFNDYSKYDYSIAGGDPNHAKDESEVVAFSDNTYDMTQDIGQAIDMTNIILEVFAVITLIGSAIVCISVTNMSVLERRKEIGLLRALGASKGDVGWVFESESLLTGLAGGLLGSLLTYILTFPVNALVNAFYPNYYVGSIATMAWWHPLVLVALSVVLASLAALLPSMKAAKKKPVECLRGEE